MSCAGLCWKITPRSGDNTSVVPIDGIFTIAPGFSHQNMPPEIAGLLPSNEGPRAFIDRVLTQPNWPAQFALGLFMSDPFLSIESESQRLIAHGVQWVTNLPSVDQHEEEFTQQLSDVGLDQTREFNALTRFKEAGMNIALIVSAPEKIEQIVQLCPDAVIVIPKVTDFAAGFPSPRQRGSSVHAVHAALRERDWRGPVIGYGDESETSHQSQWPDVADALMSRPIATDAIDLTG